MRSKNWFAGSVLACGVISLCSAARVLAQPAPAATVPAVALIDAGDAPDWEARLKPLGWRVISAVPAVNNIDARVQALAKAVEEAPHAGVDPARVYLVGRGEAAAAVFYTISRVPDLWAAALALGGSPEKAIDTDRIFAANFSNVPVLWVSNGAGDEKLAATLKQAGLNLEWRAAQGFTERTLFEWLAPHKRDPFPPQIDCETNSPTYARCYWIRITRFDPGERNDVLPTTHMAANPKPWLDLGEFVYKPDDPGPGLLVDSLPAKYSGPLRTGDRIVALEGRPVENPRRFEELMAKYTEEKPVVATVQRGKERVRIETRIVVPRPDVIVTARVQGQYSAADRDIQIVSRTVKEMKVTVPPQWAQGGRLYWNGLSLEKVDQPGCLLLTIDKEFLHSSPCAD